MSADMNEELLIDVNDDDAAEEEEIDIFEMDVDKLDREQFYERFGCDRDDVIDWDYNGEPITVGRYGGLSYYECNTDWREW